MMNKKLKVEQSRNAVRNSVKAGILPLVQVMFGYEDENHETLRETEEFFKSIPYPSPYFFVTTPLPGTALYMDCLRDGLIKDELQYLEKLGEGYVSGREILVNLTEFPEDEYYNIKKDFEARINSNYRKAYFRHSFFVLKKLLVDLDRFIYDVRNALKRGNFWERVLYNLKKTIRIS